MTSPDINLLALFADKARYEKYKDIVKTEALLVAETSTLLSDFDAYYNAFTTKTEIDFAQFRTFVRVVRHAGWKVAKHEVYDTIIGKVEEAVKSGVDDTTLGFFVRLEAAEKVVGICQEIASGKADDFTPVIEIIERAKKDSVTSDVSELYGPTDLSAVLDHRVRHDGIDWRLESLNTSAGPLHGGDLVLIAGRPEGGKTSFICSELTHMVKYLAHDKDAVIFNPEEGGGRLFLRLITAATGQDLITVASDESAAKVAYEGQVGSMSRIKVVEPSGGITTRMVERVLDTGKFGLVAINVLDKIRPSFKQRDESDVARYRALAYWMREAANRYQVPILAVAQASEAAEGQRYLTQSMIYGSKTGVQGEIDLFLGLGYDPSIDTRRWISLLKNKLPGGPRTIAANKHAKFELEFEPATGRFKDI